AEIAGLLLPMTFHSLQIGLFATVREYQKTGLRTAVRVRGADPLQRESDPETMRRISDAGVIVIAAAGAHIARIVLPRPRPNDTGKTVPTAPCRPVGRRSLIVLVPVVGDPLVDAAPHVEQAKRIGLKTSDLH